MFLMQKLVRPRQLKFSTILMLDVFIAILYFEKIYSHYRKKIFEVLRKGGAQNT